MKKLLGLDFGALTTRAEALAKDKIQVNGSTPEELGAYIASEIEKWAPVVEASGATLN